MAESSTTKTILTVLIIVIFPLVLVFLLIKPVSISGSSMEPNYVNGDRYIALKQVHKVFPPKRGDVIMFHLPDEEDYRFVSRIIGLPGEQVRVENGDVYIDNSILTEDYLEPEVETEMQEGMSLEDTSADTAAFELNAGVDILKEGENVIVPADRYFVLSDNRDNAIDSRNYGFIEKSGIIAKLVFQY
jgi:signal peptidase I